MKNVYVHKAISPELSKQIDEMILRIKTGLGFDINKYQASKIIAWKSKSYTVNINEKKLIEILGGRI